MISRTRTFDCGNAAGDSGRTEHAGDPRRSYGVRRGKALDFGGETRPVRSHSFIIVLFNAMIYCVILIGRIQGSSAW